MEREWQARWEWDRDTGCWLNFKLRRAVPYEWTHHHGPELSMGMWEVLKEAESNPDCKDLFWELARDSMKVGDRVAKLYG